ncbi:MAG: CARDB domain-containing protein, partial [Dehalococcoidales bacterium]|nr:CARDB domain-containing protein [Dehalococcoidales bacterium]
MNNVCTTPPAVCTASPTNPKVGETVTWSLSAADTAAYITSGLGYVKSVSFGTDPNVLTSAGALSTGVSSKTKTYTAEGTQYAQFAVYTDYQNVTDIVTESCSVVVAATDACGTGSGSTPQNTEPTGTSACASGTLNASSPADTTSAWNWSCGSVATCSAPKSGCASTTLSNCALLATDSGSSSGSCNSGSSGSCSYTCDNGTWSQNSNSCTLLPDLTAGTITPITATVGIATTLSVSITNNGTGNTGTTFHTIFQSAADINGTSPGNPTAGSDIVGLNASASKTTTLSWKPSTAKVYYLRACADNDTSWSGLVTESNENNNCGAWTAITVSVPAVDPIAVSLTASPAGPLTAPGATTLTWTTTGTPDSCTASNYWSGAKTASGGSELRSGIPASTQIFDITCSKAGTADATDSVSVVVNAALVDPVLPDLTAGTISPTSATVGAAVVVSSTITNVGTASTGTRFYNRFETATNITTTPVSNWSSWGTYYANILAVDGSVSASITKTLTSSGTFYVRACADRTSTGAQAITESNEYNNCSDWTLFTVSPAACTGTPLPANTTAYAAPDNTGLTANTAYSYSATDTATKCQYSCNTGYTRSGTSCLA